MVVMKLNGSFFLIIGIALILMISACSKEEETVVDPRDVLTGNWLCYEKEPGDSDVEIYEVTISAKSNDEKRLDMFNFGNIGEIVYGYMDGDSINIPIQTISGCTIEGGGGLLSDYVSLWNYSIIINGEKTDFIGRLRIKP